MRLVDHGYAFTDDRAFQSVFADLWRDQELPDELRSDVERFLNGLDESELSELLDPETFAGLRERARTLVQDGRLRLP